MEKDIIETTSKEIAVPQNTQMATLHELTLAEAQKKMELYQTYVKGLLSEEDYQVIGKQQFKKKSAWRKIGMAMNISVSKVSERTEQLPNGDFAYHFDMQAQHPNGRTMPGSGSCSAFEKATWKDGKWMTEEKQWNGRYYEKTGVWKETQPNSIHNVRSTAETRAANRAISNLIAAGEVSAEEADQEAHAEQYSYAPIVESSAQVKVKPTFGDRLYTCPTCHNNASIMSGISPKSGKPYKGLKCSADKTHMFWSNSVEYKQVVGE